MRRVAVPSLAIAGCYTYAAHSSRSRTHQGAYERAHAHAEQVGDRELLAALEQLGASKDYNEGTDVLAKCMDSRAQVERWKRQTEAGDLLTQQSILAQASSSSNVLREESVYDSQAAQMLRDLVHVKTSNAMINTNGKPLGIHPVVRSQGLEGAFATDLKKLITTYAGVASSQNVSVMYTLNAGECRFAAGAVVGGKVQAIPVPCSTTPTISMKGTTGVLGHFIDQVLPTP